jgi:hypothetical protein
MLYVDAEPAFIANGAVVEIDIDVPSNGIMTVTKGDITLVILENKNYVLIESVFIDSSILILDSVVVNQNGKFYVPQSVIDLVA